MRTQGCRVAAAIGLGMMGAIVTFPTAAPAQVVADPSIGTIATPNDTTFQITGGTIAGNRNLFHSFSRFDVPTGGVANFLNSPNIVNIFSRVTGGTASQIDGIVRSAGTANLFLMNPSGIIFGTNAQLDVGGSFVTTTANAIQFGDRGVFSAFISESPSQLLTIDPSALVFNQTNIAPIQSNSSNLGVLEGQSLVLIGGDVTLDNSSLYVSYFPGGRVELGGLAAPGRVDLTLDGSIFRLGFPDNISRANVLLKNGSSVDVTAGGGGSIAINAQNLSLQNSSLFAGIAGGYGTPASKAGDIDIKLSGTLTVEENSRISNDVSSRNFGNGGDINIYVRQFVERDSQVSASTFSAGSAGNIFINVSGLVDLSGVTTNSGPGGLFAQVEKNGVGHGGDLTLITKQLNVSDGSKVQVATLGNGDAGNLFIHAAEINVFETGKPHQYSTAINAGVTFDSNVNNSPKGNGGNLTIETGRLSIRNGAEVTVDTSGRGDAGKLLVKATDLVEVVGQNSFLTADVNSGAAGQGGSLEIKTANLVVREGARLSVDTRGTGNAGSLSIEARQFIERDSQVSASTFSAGSAGNIFINVSGLVDLSGVTTNSGPGGLFAQVEKNGVGHGGDLTLITKQLNVSDGSKVQVATLGNGDAGNLFIHAAEINVFETGKPHQYSTAINAGVTFDSNVNNSPKGNGGNLTIETGRLSIRNGAEVTVDTSGRGDAGKAIGHRQSRFSRGCRTE